MITILRGVCLLLVDVMINHKVTLNMLIINIMVTGAQYIARGSTLFTIM